MANKLILKRSAVPLKVPLAGDLEPGELAVNLADQKLYSKKPDGTVILVGFGLEFPAGTKMMFVQTTAPIGWTKDTTHNNKALRVVSGTAGSGGTVGFTTAFASNPIAGTVDSVTATNQSTATTGTVGGTTLSQSQMPSHSHAGSWGSFFIAPSEQIIPVIQTIPGGSNTFNVSSTGGGASHTHSFTQDAHTHTQDAHTHTFTGTAIDLSVQYVDVIIATKD